MSSEELKVVVAKDRSTAELVLPAQMPRETLTRDFCRVVLTEAEVRWTPAVETAVDAWLGELPPLGKDARQIVARSEPPRHGRDEKLIWSVDPPDDDKEGGTDHYERSAYVVVVGGQVLGEMIPAVMGTDGADVTGRVIAARQPRAAPTRLDDTILVDADNKLVAQTDGVLIRGKGKACIRKRLTVEGYIDFGTGNIDFPGPIVVHGGIRDRFVVKASEDIEVEKLIEGATIECGGSLVARSGIASKDYSQIDVRGDLAAHYLDNVTGTVRGHAVIAREVVNCQLSVEKKLECGRGTIIGGTVSIGDEAMIGSAGSSAGIRTRLALGKLPRLEESLAQSSQILSQLTTMKAKLKVEEERLKSSRLTGSEIKERLTELAFELERLSEYIGKVEDSQELFGKALYRRVVDLKVQNRLYEGVRIVAGDQELEVQSELAGPFTVRVMDGKNVALLRENQEPMPLARLLKAVRMAA